MKEILEQLIRRPGILGGVVVTRDGIPVHAEVRPPLEAEKTTLAVSTLARIANQAVAGLGAKDFVRASIDARSLYVQLIDSGDCYLAVISEGPVDIDRLMLDITRR